TLTGLRPADFESAAYAISPPGRRPTKLAARHASFQCFGRTENGLDYDRPAQIRGCGELHRSDPACCQGRKRGLLDFLVESEVSLLGIGNGLQGDDGGVVANRHGFERNRLLE